MNHFATIWTSPRSTVRDLLDTKPGRLFFPFAVTYGIAHNLDLVIRHRVDSALDAGVLKVLIANVLFGSIYGIGSLFLMSYLLAILSGLLGGTISPGAAHTVLAWSSVPFVPLLVMTVGLLLVFGEPLIVHSRRELIVGAAGGALQFVSLSYFVWRAVLGLWSLLMMVIGISEASGVSKGRSVVILLLAAMVMGALVILGLAAMDNW